MARSFISFFETSAERIAATPARGEVAYDVQANQYYRSRRTSADGVTPEVYEWELEQSAVRADVPIHSTTADYVLNELVVNMDGASGTLYRARVAITGTDNTPLTDTTSWQSLGGGGTTPTRTDPTLTGPSTHDFSSPTALTFTITPNNFAAASSDPVTGISVGGTAVTPAPTIRAGSNNTLLFDLPASLFTARSTHSVAAIYTDSDGGTHNLFHTVNTIEPVFMALSTLAGTANNRPSFTTGDIGSTRFRNTGLPVSNDRDFDFSGTGNAFVAYPRSSSVTWHNRFGNITPSITYEPTFNTVDYRVDVFVGVDGDFRLTMET